MAKKLEVNNLIISFRTNNGTVKAVRDISFDLEKGETLAIVGESGSGKSVTARAIMGILAKNAIPEGGEIIYDGQDLMKIDEEDFHKIRGNRISMIFQDPLSSLNHRAYRQAADRGHDPERQGQPAGSQARLHHQDQAPSG